MPVTRTVLRTANAAELDESQVGMSIMHRYAITRSGRFFLSAIVALIAFGASLAGGGAGL